MMTTVESKREPATRAKAGDSNADRDTSLPKKRGKTNAEPRDKAPPSWMTLWFGLASAVLVWASFPPLAWWPLAWVAPLFWILLIRMKQLPGRRPYLMLYLAGFVHWMALFQFVRLSHWAAYFGWVALSLYLAAYLPVFVGLARVSVHRMGVSVIIAAPAMWTGLELARGHLFTGLAMALLGHTQVEQTVVIQIADVFGAYGVSFVLMFVAACVARMIPLEGRRFAAWPAAAILAMFTAVFGYGWYRMSEAVPDSSDTRVARVALIQESVDTIFHTTREAADADEKSKFEKYCRLTRQAREEYPDLDLIVWPESAFKIPDVLGESDEASASDGEIDWKTYVWMQTLKAKGIDLEKETDENPSPDIDILVGTSSIRRGENSFQLYNTALLFGPKGEVKLRYHKMHPVVFGEYVPFGNYFPWVYNLTPLPVGLTPGERPEVFDVAGLTMSPNICFESTVPHLIRRQISQLEREGTPPDVLVNVTDDGWFFGSSCLDLHLACSVFRAVENRRPTLVAANTGFSAWIDGSGRILRKGPRRDVGIVYAEVRADGRTSLYQRLGDLPAGICLAFCLIALVTGLGQRFRRWQQRSAESRIA